MKEVIKRGDIIVFNDGDNWLSEIICWLTGSIASHTAMAYESDIIMEMGKKGIGINKISLDDDESNAQVLRLNPSKSGAPLVDAAKSYIEQTVVYDVSGLVTLAGQMIYRPVRPTLRLQNTIDIVIEEACHELDKMLQVIVQNKKDNKAIACSQWVYQVYHDCGADYQIQIKNNLQNQGKEDDMICIADLLAQKRQNNELHLDSRMLLETAGYDEKMQKALMEELFFCLVESEVTTKPDIDLDYTQTVAKAETFMVLLEKILEEIESDLPVEALFVTPADLLGAKNLEKVCECHVARE